MNTLVTGIATVKDESDIIAATVSHMLTQVDNIIVADNLSTDGTRDILSDLAARYPSLTIIDDPEVGYYQSRKMSALAALAHSRGAEWVVPFDADEIWYATGTSISNVLRQCNYAIAPAELYDHVATGLDPDTPCPVERMRWRRTSPGKLPKVACRPALRVAIDQGNHGASYANSGCAPAPLLVVRHFPYRSVAQFVKKVKNGYAAYQATDLPESYGRHWRDYGKLLESGGEEAIGDVFRRWFWYADPKANQALILDPCPNAGR